MKQITTRLLKNTSFVVLGFVFSLAAVFGFMFLFFNESDATAPSLGDPSVDSRDLSTPTTSSTSTAFSLRSIEDIEQELKWKGPFHRTLTLHTFLSSASVKEHGDLFQLAENIRPITLRDEIRDTIVRRLSLLKPTEAISLIIQIPKSHRDALIETAFREMAFADLNQATALAKTLDPAQRQSALRGILRGSEDVPDDQLLEVATQLGDQQSAIDSIALAKIGAGIEDPDAMWTELLNEYGKNIGSLSHAQIQLLANVARVWIEESGLSGIQSVYSSLKTDDSRVVLLSNLLQELNQSSPQLVLEVAEWIKETDLEVLTEAFSDWAEMNPRIALEVAVALEVGKQNMRIQRSVMKSWIESNPNSVLEELSQLPVRLQNWSLQEALIAMTTRTPEIVPAWLEEVDDASSKDNIFVRLVSNWAEHDPKAALQWIQTDPYAQEKSPQMMVELMESLAQIDPSHALEFALDYQSDDSYPGLEAWVIIETTRVDVERGIAMLENARNQVTLEFATIGVGGALVRQGEIDRAVELSTNMSEELKGRYFSQLAVAWARADLESLLGQLDSLQSEEVRTSIVQELLLRHSLVQTFSTEQLNTLKNSLSE